MAKLPAAGTFWQSCPWVGQWTLHLQVPTKLKWIVITETAHSKQQIYSLLFHLSTFLYQSTGKPINDRSSLGENSQSPQLSPHKPSNEATAALSSHITPTKSSVTLESRVDSLHTSPVKQSSKAAEASGKSTEEAPSGTEDILDVLASRIDQLAASDSEDDIFGGMFCFII